MTVSSSRLCSMMERMAQAKPLRMKMVVEVTKKKKYL